jgi:hypothetical protein
MFFENLKGSVQKIPVGIHTVKFAGITFNGSYVDINFEDNEGRRLHKRLFDPFNVDSVSVGSVQEKIDENVKRNLTLLVTILRTVASDDVARGLDFPSYDEFIKGVSTILDEYRGTLVNIKVVPDWRERRYPELAKYGFIEKYQEGVEPTLKFSEKQVQEIAEYEANLAAREN